MSGQIDTNKYVIAIKEKQAEIDGLAAAGKANLIAASAKIIELKTLATSNPILGPSAPVEKVVVVIDYDELSLSLLKSAWGTARRNILEDPRAKKPNTRADRLAIRRIWAHTHFVKLAATVGTTIEEINKYKNTGSIEAYNRYIAGYTGAAGYDVYLYHTKMQKRYNTISDEHPESSDILDWTGVLQKYWEVIQRIKK